MAGLDHTTPIPTTITLHRQSRILEIMFNNGQAFKLPFEYLRVYSPSAEVRGHGAGQEVLQAGKRNVIIDQIKPVGHYAIKLVFSDGHDTGIYSWDHLYKLGNEYNTLWQQYLDHLAQAGASRDEPNQPAPKKSGCNHTN